MTSRRRRDSTARAGEEANAVQVLRRAGEAAARRLGLQEADADALGVDFAAHFLAERPWPDPSGPPDTEAYIRQAAEWYAFRHARRQQRQPISLDEAALDAHPAAPDDLVSLVSMRQTMRKVQDAVRRLPKAQQEVFRLCVVEDLSCAEAARQMGCSAAAARKRLERLRAHLEQVVPLE